MASDNRYIVGFKTEQDVRLTLAAMEKKGWRSMQWMGSDIPTQWNGWVRADGDYSELALSYKNGFGLSIYRSERNNIDFKDAIRELTGTRTSTVCEPKKITDHNDLGNYLGRNFTGKIEGREIAGTIKEASGHPTFYFNYVDGKPDGLCWSYDKEINGVKYARGWHIGNVSDLDRFRDIVITPEEVFTEQLPVTATDAMNELPEYFTISSKHSAHPLWKKYIAWLNKQYYNGPSDSVTGTMDGFYGSHRNTDKFNSPSEMRGEKEITLEEWDSIINGTKLTGTMKNELPKYFSVSTTEKDHPLWSYYINWLCKTFKSNVAGGGAGWYGIFPDTKDRYKSLSIGETNTATLITLGEWDSIVNRTNPISTLESPVVEIPEYFYITRDEENPLWTEYFDWIQSKTEGSHWLCTDKKYMGYDGSAGKGGTVNSNNYDDFRSGTQEITLEFWDKYIRNPVTTQYEKLVETHKKVITEDIYDPYSRMRYHIPMEPQLTPYVMSNPDLVAEADDYMRSGAARARTATGASKLIKPSSGGLIDTIADREYLSKDNISQAMEQLREVKRMTVDVGDCPIRTGMSYPVAPAPTKKGSRYSDMLSNI